MVQVVWGGSGAGSKHCKSFSCLNCSEYLFEPICVVIDYMTWYQQSHSLHIVGFRATHLL
jgi:hypothetical protein